MACAFCGLDIGHDRFCPLPRVAAPAGGVSTSDWVDALMAVLSTDGTTWGPLARLWLTEALVLHDRAITRTNFIAGVTQAMAAVRRRELAAALPTDQRQVNAELNALLINVLAATPAVTPWGVAT